jgi:response regulator RpfG family c-di-GMP phosphodiesterase
LEDEPAVLSAVVRDLAPFEDAFQIVPVESVAEARKVLATLTEKKIPLALALCDHLLPGVSGTEFLVELNHAEKTRATRKVLITAQAGLSDTVKAINEGNLNHYIGKPWQPEDLRAVVCDQLTSYLLATKTNPLPYLSVLDAPRLLEAMQGNNLTTDE